jgi:nitroreductase
MSPRDFPVTPESIAAVDAAIISRRSIRAFQPTPVPRETIEEILAVSARAPSGTNTQPWRVHVLKGAVLGKLVDAVCAAFDAADGTHTPEYNYYPPEFFEPYLGRRRKVGWDLYSRIGIAKGDGARMKAQHRKNFEFFGAPVGLIFTIDRKLGQGSWLDYGMFLQNVMLAAEARGLATCPQAAWIDYHRIIGEHLQLPSNEQVVCGIALGHADPDAPENALVSERAELAEFVVRHQ